MKLFLLLCLLLAQCFYGANPVDEPIVESQLRVRTRLYAQLPNFRGNPASINSIVSEGGFLYICDNISSRIFRVSASGNVQFWFDVRAGVSASIGRNVDNSNSIHGGLRGIAFHPSFRSNGLFYTSFMEQRPDNTANLEYLSDVPSPIEADGVVAEWRVNLSTMRPQLNSYRQVVRIGTPIYDNTIKQIAFMGNLLFIAHGVPEDLTSTGANSALGTILRINPLRNGNLPYTVPNSNPFISNPNILNEVWAFGFRNPHHICFSASGELFVADSGDDNVEEVNLVSRGGNYGWPSREGTFVHLETGGILTGISPLPANDASNGFTYPAAQVGHDGPRGAGFVGQAIAGGCPVQNGSPLSGKYFYSDFPLSGRLFYSELRELRRATTRGRPTNLTQATTFEAKIILIENGREKMFDSLGDVVRSAMGGEGTRRADIRLGRGSGGELYWSSKGNGAVYVVENSEV